MERRTEGNPISPLFELSQVSCQFGSLTALTAISLQIYPGERVALVGPSGAGKSTLLSLLNGSLVPSQGQVRIMGHNLAQMPLFKRRQVQRQIGTVYQQHHLISHLAVVHNVNAGHLGRWPLWKAVWSLVWPLQVEVATRALAQVGIADKLYARTDRLSGGQQQRVALARVLVQDPVAMLADEPIASVDPERSREVMDLLKHLCETTDKTLVVSLHDVNFALSHCDRLIGLRAGTLLFDCPVAEASDRLFQDLYALPTATS
ncbi:phosphonate ABC transporter ATP-binding protein [Almyronema epifaneia]|uniref:Phosphonate ABC transporter ATP-binding protein n=1 Tax=Almyronema epifaneia S1 TaxID=2991925 RepID=A0ABW6IJX9_9CYAN